MKKRFLMIICLAILLASLVIFLIFELSGGNAADAEGFGYKWYMVPAGAALGVGVFLFAYSLSVKRLPYYYFGWLLTVAGLFPFVFYYQFFESAWAKIVFVLIVVVIMGLLRFAFNLRTVAYAADNEKPGYKHYTERRKEEREKEEALKLSKKE